MVKFSISLYVFNFLAFIIYSLPSFGVIMITAQIECITMPKCLYGLPRKHLEEKETKLHFVSSMSRFSEES